MNIATRTSILFLSLLLVACSNSGGSDHPPAPEPSQEINEEINNPSSNEQNKEEPPTETNEPTETEPQDDGITEDETVDNPHEDNTVDDEEITDDTEQEINDDQEDDSSTDITTPCNPLHIKNCLLPFPSDIWSESNDASPTGIRLKFPENFIAAEIMDEFPPSITIENIFNSSNGFSAATAVLFELDGAPQLDTLPADGGESVIAIDLATGLRTPITVAASEYARSSKVKSPADIIEIMPRARWQFGHRYVVAITDKIKPQEGENYLPSEGFSNLLNGNNTETDLAYDTAFDYLEAAGVSRDSLLSATLFTVRTEDEATSRLKNITEQVYQNDHPVSNLWVIYGNGNPVAATVTGSLKIDNYRANDGGMDFDLNEGKTQWVNFRLTLPGAANTGSVPVSIYGHGITASKETDLVVADTNAKFGVATISIDQPNHGSRIQQDGGWVMHRLAPAYLPVQIGMLTHSSIDFMSLLKALNTSLAELNVLPQEDAAGISQVLNMDKLDIIPDLDSDRIYYQGTSLGGVLGSTFLALAPTVKGAFLQVPGSGITKILAESVFWDEFFYKLIPKSANGVEALLLRAAIQQELDYGDSINFVQYFRNPPQGISSKPLMLLVAKDDLVVPNNSTIAMAEIAELPLVGQELFPMPGLIHSDDMVDGYGVQQIPSISHLLLGIPFIDGLLAHGSFVSPEAQVIMEHWLESVVLQE